ncbi:MAG TPA: transglutaminase family protein [Candidatus Acidoferrales bacterium]|nr:transglutaminase family protein [Candidatus Acidoferrales bacterium]
MRYVVEHRARRHFEQAVREHQCELRIVPRDDAHQTLVGVKLTTEPDAAVNGYVDYFGNRVTHVEIVKPHDEVTTQMRAEVETRLDNPFDFPLLAPVAERNWLRDELQRQPRLWDFVLHRSALTPDITRLEGEDISWPTYDAQEHLMDMLLTARDWLSAVITLDSELSDPRAASEVLKTRSGNAQDMAHLLVSVVRRWGFAARYVTGYRENDPDEEKADEAALHAWAEVLIPGAGWRGFDPAMSLVVNSSYVAVGVGRDADDVPFLRSSFRGADEASVQVQLRLLRQEEAAQQQ